MTIDYQGFTGSNSQSIEIMCSGLKNPNLPSIVSGFSVLVFDSTYRFALDFSGDNLKIDSREFNIDEISNEQISYRLSHQHANELSDYNIEFETDLLIDA